MSWVLLLFECNSILAVSAVHRLHIVESSAHVCVHPCRLNRIFVHMNKLSVLTQAAVLTVWLSANMADLSPPALISKE